jgi:MFS family permease
MSSVQLAYTDAQIGLGYAGGFVARSSSVGISLFIPLFVNSFFISSGLCTGSPTDPSPELKKECRRAYVLAAELTGISQLVALICAPLLGYLSDRYRRFNAPLLASALFGVMGYTSLAQLKSPEPKDVDGRGGSPAVFIIVALIGISQIGAIVCSLGLLGRGVLGDEGGYNLSRQLNSGTQDQAPMRSDGVHDHDHGDDSETEPLLAAVATRPASRHHLKGSIAGFYSLSGGAGILLLTKLGGFLFDCWTVGAPFYMLAIFNALLLAIGLGNVIYREFGAQRKLRNS